MLFGAVRLMLAAASLVLLCDADKECLKTFIHTEAVVTYAQDQKRILLNQCAGSELQNAIEIEVKGKEVPSVKTGAFRDIDTLKKVAMVDCKIFHIDRNILLNLPNIKTLLLKRNNFEIVPELAFANLTSIQHIDLSENHLKNVQHDAFRDSNNLVTVNLNRNKLTHYYPSWFKPSSETIETIDLSHNKFKYFARSSFKGLNKLTTLLLNNNQLRSLHPQSFEEVTSLQTLDLSHNYIAELYRQMTASFAKSKIDLRLNNNHLNYLLEETMSHVQFGKVSVHANPWKCACYNKILTWAEKYKNDVQFADNSCGDRMPVCIEQERFPKKCTQQKDPNITQQYYYSYEKIACNK
ncbi:PREDICTED: phospholipase A2 inhibitor-like [Nicrophorus vespilloides]|uniref:Phospholipase A2 inhibitor-like n=1 Tax=Nicrophorus vespilloides TaxID=110193 RepID=A0ABM1MBS9_NICVS|nr:PREDICTED: phospholipase A2 inhibitor-like [Nicrophorus vespilloides]